MSNKNAPGLTISPDNARSIVSLQSIGNCQTDTTISTHSATQAMTSTKTLTGGISLLIAEPKERERRVKGEAGDEGGGDGGGDGIYLGTGFLQLISFPPNFGLEIRLREVLREGVWEEGIDIMIDYTVYYKRISVTTRIVRASTGRKILIKGESFGLRAVGEGMPR